MSPSRRKLRVLVLIGPGFTPPDDIEQRSEQEKHDYKTEYDILTTLKALGHDARPLEVHDELAPIRREVEEWKPHVVVNLLEAFFDLREFDQHVVSYLELLRVPYTGCNPRGLVLARDKSLAKKILTYHRIPVPKFDVVHQGRRVRRPKALGFPLIVKSLTEESSVGIAQASVVWSDEELEARVRFIHESITGDALIEEFIDGREIYVGALGSKKTHASRVSRLGERGFSPDDIARIRGPIGLDIGARSVGEIAISIVGQITETLRRGKPA